MCQASHVEGTASALHPVAQEVVSSSHSKERGCESLSSLPDHVATSWMV